MNLTTLHEPIADRFIPTVNFNGGFPSEALDPVEPRTYDDELDSDQILYGERLMQSVHDGVSGVRVFDSGIEGPTLILSSSVHGGEPAGRQVQYALEHEFHIQEKLTKGRVIFILANPEGYKKYLETGDHHAARIVDENMNRACTPGNVAYGSSYESKRAFELKRILEESDMHIDIHSVNAKTKPGKSSFSIISQSSKKMAEILARIVDVQVVGVIDHQIGAPFVGISERNGALVAGIETGSHLDTSGFRVGFESVISSLCFLSMIDIKDAVRNITHDKPYSAFNVFGSYQVKEGFVFERPFANFEYVYEGELIGKDGDEEIRAKEGFHITIPMNSGASPGNEAYFMSQRHIY